MSNGITKETTVKLNGIRQFLISDFTEYATNFYKIAFPDDVYKFTILGSITTVDLFLEATVTEADPSTLPAFQWGTYDGFLYVNMSTYGPGADDSINVYYTLYLSEIGVYADTQPDDPTGTTVFYEPYVIKLPTMGQSLTNGLFGFIPSVTSNIEIGYDLMEDRFNDVFKNQTCSIFETIDGTLTTTSMQLTGSISVKEPVVSIEVTTLIESFNNSFDFGDFYNFTSSTDFYIKCGRSGLSSTSTLAGYDTSELNAAVEIPVGLKSGVKAFCVSAAAEAPVDGGATDTADAVKAYYNNSVFWVPNIGYSYNGDSYGLYTKTTAGLRRFVCFVTQATSSTRVYIENVSAYSDLFIVSATVDIDGNSRTITAVGSNYIDIDTALSVTIGMPVYVDSGAAYNITMGNYSVSASGAGDIAGSTKFTLSHLEGITVDMVVINDNGSFEFASSIVSIDYTASTIDLFWSGSTPSEISIARFSQATLIKNNVKYILNPNHHFFLPSADLRFTNSGGTDLPVPNRYGMGFLIALNWPQIKTDFNIDMQGGEQLYVAGTFGSVNETDALLNASIGEFKTITTIDGDYIHPRNYDTKNRNKTHTPSHAGWLLYTLMREYVGVSESLIDANSFLTIDTIDYGIGIKPGVLMREYINDILEKCMLRMFINKNGRWELSKVEPFSTRTLLVIEDYIRLLPKYNASQIFGVVSIKNNVAGNYFNLYRVYASDAYSLGVSYKEKQISTPFIEAFPLSFTTSPRSLVQLLGLRYAALYGYRVGRTIAILTNKYREIEINDVITIDQKSYAVLSINKTINGVELELDDQIGIEKQATYFEVNDILEGGF